MSGARDLGRAVARRATQQTSVRRALRWAALQGYLPQPVWHRLPPNQATFEVPMPGGGAFTYAVDNEDPFVRELFWRGLASAEGVSVAAFFEQARHATLVVDVGGHTGLYSLTALAANPTSRVIAFEPVPANVRTFEANLASNGWVQRADVRPQAVSNQSGTMQVHVPYGDHPMSASLDPAGFRGLPGELMDVEVTSLDAALEGASVDLVKVDVEGFEDRVLEGAGATLERCRPVIMIECNPDGPYERVEAMLRPLGYRFTLLDGRNSAPTDRIHPDPAEVYRNVMCTPTGG